MKRIALGVLPNLFGAGSAVELCHAKDSDPYLYIVNNPRQRVYKEKESWQGQGKRKKSYQHRGKR